MRANHWAKVWIDLIDNPKLGLLPDNLWRRCIEMVLLAKELDEGGQLPPTQKMAWRLRLPGGSAQLSGELEEIQKLTGQDGTPFVSNYSIHGAEELDYWYLPKFEAWQGAMPGYERVARHRALKALKTKDKDTYKELKRRDNKPLHKKSPKRNDMLQTKDKFDFEEFTHLKDAAFEALWDEKIEQRKEAYKEKKHSKFTYYSQRRMLIKLQRYPLPVAAKMLQNSIDGNWAGVFELKPMELAIIDKAPKDLGEEREQQKNKAKDLIRQAQRKEA